LNLLGLSLQRVGNPADAAAAFRESLRIQPQNAEIQNNLGLPSFNLATATGANRRLFALRCRFIPAILAIRAISAPHILQKADYAAAEAEFRSALSASTDNQTLHYNLGLALKLQDNCGSGH